MALQVINLAERKTRSGPNGSNQPLVSVTRSGAIFYSAALANLIGLSEEKAQGLLIATEGGVATSASPTVYLGFTHMPNAQALAIRVKTKATNYVSHNAGIAHKLFELYQVAEQVERFLIKVLPDIKVKSEGLQFYETVFHANAIPSNKKRLEQLKAGAKK